MLVLKGTRLFNSQPFETVYVLNWNNNYKGEKRPTLNLTIHYKMTANIQKAALLLIEGLRLVVWIITVKMTKKESLNKYALVNISVCKKKSTLTFDLSKQMIVGCCVECLSTLTKTRIRSSEPGVLMHMMYNVNIPTL